MAVRVPAEAAQRSPISNRLRWTFASVGLAAALAGCGGGGDDAPAAAPPPPPPPPPPPVATTLTGTAATGAALAGAALQVVDASGATVCETSTAADGVYSCTLAATVQRPLVIRAVKDETVLYSATAATGDTRANVTPLTHIIASRLAPNGDASALAGAIQRITPAALAAQTATLLTALQPLLAAMGNLTIDPVAGELVANGTGQDKLLDAIAVTVRTDGTAANIEITVKTVPTTANPDPVSIRFSSNASTVPTLPAAVATADLGSIPAPSVVDALVSRLTACFALPLSQRVNAPNDASPVVGAAADVIAPACRSLFVDDNPATYLSGGSRVGRSASNTGSFAGLFRPGATGLVFSDAKFEYFRTNGDMVVSAKWRDSQGTTANDTYVVRNVGSVLKLIGNQYAYSATVRPFAEDRELLNTPQFNYFTTGYNIRVDNRTDGSGNPIFSKVVVTTPWGGTYTLLPVAGQALLAIALDGHTPGATSVLRLAAGYRDTARTDDPSVKESNLVYTAPLRTDADILALQDQGRWSFEFFHADTSVPNVVQASRTLVRPYTIGEIRLRPFAQFTASTRADLVAESSALGYALFTQPDTAQLGDASAPAWTVPVGALAPTSAGVFGRAPFGSTTPNVIGNRFDDVAAVSSTARFATIFCSAQTASDKHCDASTPGLYAVNTLVSQVELWGLGEKQVEFSKKGGLYKLQ